jgi:hypothetical protein
VATVEDKLTFTKLVSKGIRKVADWRDKALTVVEPDIWALVDGNRTWRNAGEVSFQIEDRKLMGFVWLVLEESDLGVDWLGELLAATSSPMAAFPSLTAEEVKACLKVARKRSKEGEELRGPTEEEIKKIIERLFHSELENKPSEGKGLPPPLSLFPSQQRIHIILFVSRIKMH